MQDAQKQHQIELEKLYSKNQLLKRVIAVFKASPMNFAEGFKILGFTEAFGFDVLAQMAIYKRPNLATMVGLLRHHYGCSQLTADALVVAADNDMMNWSTEHQTFVVRFTLPKEVQDEIDMFQYPFPMVVAPKTVRSNKETGYLTTAGSLILKNNHHDEDICLDHINRLNAVRLTLEPRVAYMIKNKWAKLDKQKPGESIEDYDARQRAFEKYDKTAKNVMEIIYAAADHFYLTHKYDKRGRTYCQGYHVNYQGNAWNKAVIALADKEHVL